MPDDPDHRLPCAERRCDYVCVLLVDRRGWVLLQERDEHAPTAPDQWGMVGGHVDPGEEPWTAVRRELLEETGLTVADGVLRLWYDGDAALHVKSRPGLVDHWRLWVGAVDLADADVTCGEGRRIVFVDPDRLDELDLAASTAYFVPRLIASPTYRELAGAG